MGAIPFPVLIPPSPPSHSPPSLSLSLSSTLFSLEISLTSSPCSCSMASEPEISEISSLFERLMSSRDLSVFFPFLFGFSQENPDREDGDNRSNGRDRIILVNPFTQGMVVIEGASSFESLLRELGGKKGQPPASKASIEAMQSEEIREEGDCRICLDEFEIGCVVKKMPCDHKFHGDCIKTWLEIHGSCPVCRFLMPVDEEVGKKSESESEREIWVSFSFSNGSRNLDSSQSSSSEVDSSSSRSDEFEG